MPEPIVLLPVPPAPDRLDSWKDIAAFFGREVRTVQGWEKNEGLPVHRHRHARQGSVYAFKSELEAWRKQRASRPEAETVAPVETAPASAARSWRIAPIAGLCAVLLAVAAFFVWKHYQSTGSESSVVVLPFVDMSPGKDQEYFSDGLTEEIIDALSRVPNLRVVARTSAFEFKGKPHDIREIGRQLNVSTVLEGSVRKAGQQLRITAQLNRVSDGTHLWSHTYDRPLRDIFALQREISQAIASQLGAGQIAHRESTTDLEAYRLYQEGRYFFNQFDIQGSFEKAVERFEQAIQRDPKFALAYSGMADAYAYQSEGMTKAPKEVMPKAKEAAEKAIALDPALGAAHTSLGIVKLDYDWDIPGAEREFRRAIDLNPGSGYGNHWLGHALEAELRLNDAIEQFRASLALDPLSVPIYWDLASEFVANKRYGEARNLLGKARELFPNNLMFPTIEIPLYLHMGDVVQARRIRDAWKPPPEMADVPQLIGGDGLLAAWEGKLEDARKALARLDEMRKTQYVDAIFPGMLICSALKDRECVMTWLKRGYEDRSALFPYIRVYFPDTIAGIPEAQALVEKALGK